jgi:hypothetical protein
MSNGRDLMRARLVLSLAFSWLALSASRPAAADLAVVPTGYATIQAAVDAVQGTPDATVRIDSGGIFEENVSVAESVAIVAGFSVAPQVRGSIVFNARSSDRARLELRGLLLRPSEFASRHSDLVRIFSRESGVAEARIVNCVFIDPDQVGPTAILLDSTTDGSFDVEVHGTSIVLGGDPDGEPHGVRAQGPGRLLVRNSAIAIDGAGTAISGGSPSGLDVTVEESQITVDTSLASSIALGIDVDGGGNLSVARNRFLLFSTAVAPVVGVYLRAYRPEVATLDANVFEDAGAGRGSAITLLPRASLVAVVSNNVITDVGQGLFASTGSEGGLSLVLVNNTIDGSREDAVYLSVSDGSSLLVNLWNNLLTRSGGAGILAYALAPALFEVANDYNGYYGNAEGDFSGPLAADPHGFFGSPHYVPGTVRPETSSPVRNRGLGTAPGLPLFDVAGNPRIQGSEIDLGAYEVVPEAGSALQAIAALVLLSLLARRRRAIAVSFVCLATATEPASADLAVVPVPYATIQSAVDAVEGTPNAIVRIDGGGFFAESVLVQHSVAIVAGSSGPPPGIPVVLGDIRFLPDASDRTSLRLERLWIRPGPAATGDSTLIRVDADGPGIAELDVRNCLLLDTEQVGVRGIELEAQGSLDVEITGTSMLMGGAFGTNPFGVVVRSPGRVTVRSSSIRVDRQGQAIVATSHFAPLEVVVEDSMFTINGSESFPAAIGISRASDATIARNIFYLNSTDDGAPSGISLRPSAPMRATVDANVFEGTGAQPGSAIYAEPTASLQLVATNNVVMNTRNGITLAPHVGMNALVVNNTIDGSRGRAIEIADLGGTLAAGFFNNLLTRSGLTAIAALGPDSAFAYVVNDYNGYFDNAGGDVDPALVLDPHGVFEDPHYAAGSVRPQPGSPVIDQGLSSAPGLPLFDVEDAPRIAGVAVDIGAYEVPEPGAGLGALAALLALAVRRLTRARRPRRFPALSSAREPRAGIRRTAALRRAPAG